MPVRGTILHWRRGRRRDQRTGLSAARDRESWWLSLTPGSTIFTRISKTRTGAPGARSVQRGPGPGRRLCAREELGQALGAPSRARPPGQWDLRGSRGCPSGHGHRGGGHCGRKRQRESRRALPREWPTRATILAVRLGASHGGRLSAGPPSSCAGWTRSSATAHGAGPARRGQPELWKHLRFPRTTHQPSWRPTSNGIFQLRAGPCWWPAPATRGPECRPHLGPAGHGAGCQCGAVRRPLSRQGWHVQLWTSYADQFAIRPGRSLRRQQRLLSARRAAGAQTLSLPGHHCALALLRASPAPTARPRRSTWTSCPSADLPRQRHLDHPSDARAGLVTGQYDLWLPSQAAPLESRPPGFCSPAPDTTLTIPSTAAAGHYPWGLATIPRCSACADFLRAEGYTRTSQAGEARPGGAGRRIL